MPIVIAPDGSIDVNSLRTSTDAELSTWIYARLLGRDLVVPGGTTVDDDRQLAVSIVHDRLELEHQRRVKAAVLSLLEQVVRGERAEWTDDAKGLLFRLVEVLLRQSVDQPIAARRLIEFINNATSELTARRALQALAGLEFQLPEAFWIRQYRNATFAPVVLEGLGTHSVRAAFKFLAEIEWTTTVDAALSTLLPTWAERYGRSELETAFLTTEHCFDEHRRCLLRKQLALPCATRLRLFDDLRTSLIAACEALEDELVSVRNLQHEWAGRAEVAEAQLAALTDQIRAIREEISRLAADWSRPYESDGGDVWDDGSEAARRQCAEELKRLTSLIEPQRSQQ